MGQTGLNTFFFPRSTAGPLDPSSHHLIKSKVLVPRKWLIKGKDHPSFKTFPGPQEENPTPEDRRCPTAKVKTCQVPGMLREGFG